MPGDEDAGQRHVTPRPRPAGEGDAGSTRALPRGGAGDSDRTIVLGGAAAEAAMTPAHGTPAARPSPDGDDGVAASAPPSATAGRRPAADDGQRGRHFRAINRTERERRLLFALAAAPVVTLVLIVAGWAIDATALSGQVMRNVEVAGRPVGGLGEDALPEVMRSISGDVAAQPVRIVAEDRAYDTTAGEVGLALDERRTAAAALDAGRDQPIFVRPFAWVGSFFRQREVPIHYTVSESQVTTTLFALQGGDIRAPVDPAIELAEPGFVVVPGSPGRGIDSEHVATELPAAAEAADESDGPIEVRAELSDIAPRFSDEDAQALADRANEMTAAGLLIRAGDQGEARVEAAQLRTWVRPSTDDGKLELRIDGEAVDAALPELFAGLTSEPEDAQITLEGGRPVVTPSRNGVRCCGEDSAPRILEALEQGASEVTVEVEVTEPRLTTEQAEGLGIREPVGGNHAWRDGGPASGPPGFTTYHAPGQSRVTNIHRIADLVRGAVVLPGETFSINEHVGERTAAKGFVPAGAIRNGEHVDEIGGGVSQFATTLFNAAYFAGLDIPTYQAHSEYFSRYPRGREATMGHPAPDLVIRNNTPHGILIWTSYTDTSITVTLWSTPYATADQTDISESPSGNCTVVTTTRTRTYPDGRRENDTFRATYRPGEGEFC